MSHTNYILTSDGNFVSEDELYHYGVPGMKWGRRKTYSPTSYGGSITKTGKYKASKAKTTRGKDSISEYRKERNRQNKHIATKRAIDLGSRFVNSYTKSHNVTLNGKHVGIPDNAKLFVNTMLDYKYMKDTFK